MKYITSTKRLILLVITILVIIGVIGFISYVSDYYHADNTAITALQSSNEYNVLNTTDSVTFTPTSNKSNTGIIIYPGGKVQAESYAVIASKLAQEGYTTIIVKMPFNLAFFGSDNADEVITNHPEITEWVMVGHSLGGVFASDYAVKNQDKIRGVIYLASYPSTNASNATFKAISIRGSLDGLTKNEDVVQNFDKFPANTTFITIEGGNHFNFGDYGMQAGDNNSTITREDQQSQTIKYIVEFIKDL